MTIEKREQNRAAFPELARIMDQVREQFPNAKLIHGTENGRELGRLPPEWEGPKPVSVFLDQALRGIESKRRRAA